ncbi:hypothetical protein MPSEU_000134700 [Mayamaea pseudoterrestris]|nr:hypothetical protein MPSEU_000134700 [Mayamaea pseudoterrestris]
MRRSLGLMLVCVHAACALSVRFHRVSPSRALIRHGSNWSKVISSLRSITTSADEQEIIDCNESNDYTRLPRIYVGSPEASRACSLPWAKQEQTVAPLLPRLKERLQIQLTADQSHYVSNVLRLTKKKKSSSNALLRVFDGLSGEWLARVVAPQMDDSSDQQQQRRRRSANAPLMAECLKLLRPLPMACSSPSLWLAPPKKRERVRWLIEKATELNVRQVLFLESDYSEAGAFDVDKLGIYAVEAAEQCERLDIPVFMIGGKDSTMRLDDAIQQWTSNSERNQLQTKMLFCRERGEHALPVLDVLRRLMQSCQGVADEPQISFVVGPEGGWSGREQALMDDLAKKHPDDAFIVSLGGNVLRAETAAMTAIAAYTLFTDGRGANNE